MKIRIDVILSLSHTCNSDSLIPCNVGIRYIFVLKLFMSIDIFVRASCAHWENALSAKNKCLRIEINVSSRITSRNRLANVFTSAWSILSSQRHEMTHLVSSGYDWFGWRADFLNNFLNLWNFMLLDCQSRIIINWYFRQMFIYREPNY